MCVWIENKNDDVLCLITNHNKAQSITPGMADGQQSSIFQDWYPAEALLESNGLWDGVGLKQQANRFLTSLCSQAVNPVTYSKCNKKNRFFSEDKKLMVSCKMVNMPLILSTVWYNKITLHETMYNYLNMDPAFLNKQQHTMKAFYIQNNMSSESNMAKKNPVCAIELTVSHMWFCAQPGLILVICVLWCKTCCCFITVC